jgi:hypothetical protein
LAFGCNCSGVANASMQKSMCHPESHQLTSHPVVFWRLRLAPELS